VLCPHLRLHNFLHPPHISKVLLKRVTRVKPFNFVQVTGNELLHLCEEVFVELPDFGVGRGNFEAVCDVGEDGELAGISEEVFAVREEGVGWAEPVEGFTDCYQVEFYGVVCQAVFMNDLDVFAGLFGKFSGFFEGDLNHSLTDIRSNNLSRELIGKVKQYLPCSSRHIKVVNFTRQIFMAFIE
jgi:hypothetical protein